MHNSRINGDVCTEEKKERLKAQEFNKEKEKKEKLRESTTFQIVAQEWYSRQYTLGHHRFRQRRKNHWKVCEWKVCRKITPQNQPHNHL